MSRAIEVSFSMTKELALQNSKEYYDYDMRHSAKRYIGWFFVALTQFGIVGALKHNSFGLLYISTFLVLYWYYGRWLLRKRIFLRYFEKSHKEPSEIHFRIDKEGFHSDNATISWEDVLKVVELESAFFIQTTQTTLFLQKSGFGSQEQKDAFLRIAKERRKI